MVSWLENFYTVATQPESLKSELRLKSSRENGIEWHRGLPAKKKRDSGEIRGGPANFRRDSGDGVGHDVGGADPGGLGLGFR